MTPLLAALLVLTAQETSPTGLDLIRRDARAMAPLVRSALARAFLEAGDALTPVTPRTVYLDPAARRYLTSRAAGELDAAAREKLRTIPVDDHFFYTTRYGSPVAYVRPIDLLGDAGLDSLAGKKLVDFGCGGLGPHRMLAAMGAEAIGIDVDPMLEALYSEPDDQGPYREGRVRLVLGRYPSDEATRAKVGGSIDVFLSKNTFKKGYIHPESGRTYIDLGMDDRTLLQTLHDDLKPGGFVLLYNLGPAPAPPGGTYQPMADIRTPFARDDWEAAGFQVLAFDRDDTDAALTMGTALAWDKEPIKMDLATGLFANYTLARKP